VTSGGDLALAWLVAGAMLGGFLLSIWIAP